MDKNFRLLVVDDNPDSLFLTSRILKSAGYVVSQAATAAQAWEMVKAGKPDLVLLDVVLPDFSGIEVCKRIKADAELAGTYVLLISGMMVESDNQAEGLEIGADGYIVRPVAGRELLARVESILRIRKAEQSARRSGEQVVKILEGISDGFFALDDHFVVTYFNEAAERLVGRKREEVVGRNLFEAFPEAKGSVFEEKYTQGVSEKVPLSFETYFDVKPYRGWYDVRVYPQDNGISVFFQIITERKHAERRLKEAADEIARSNKEMQQFASVATRDLQEPLRTVSSSLTTLAQRSKGRLDSETAELIRSAVDGATRMQKMIDDLLMYSRLDAHRNPPRPTDANLAVTRALDNLKIIVEQSNAVVTRDPLPALPADETQLVQVFQRLIDNAVKFRGRAGPRVHVSVQPEEKEWVFSVRDNGIGIEPEYFESLFDIFWRVDRSGKHPGTGIGLAVCKKIVELHGGRIWVQSAPGKGSTFFFTIPKQAGAAAH